ncbi:MAG: hypothetical protein GY866_20115 [Proteobacteria bacterium]|nr:hypothetical protein [Pseudomonadota bacterium]
MKSKCYSNSFLASTLAFLSIFLLIGCGESTKQTRTGQGYMDTPSFHVQRGDEALLKSQYENARSSYRKALKLDGNYSPALSGMAAATAYAVARPHVSMGTKREVLENAEAQIEQALDAVGSDDEINRSRAHNFAVQVYVALQLPEESWYEKANDHYEEARELTPNDPAPYFFMARAEAVKLDYAKATQLLHRVLGIAGKYEEEANRELKRIQRIQRALPGSQFGARIANVEKITRADVAALFIAELRLDRLYGNQSRDSDDSYSPPESQRKFKTDPLQKYPDAVDISGHPLKETINEVIKLQIKGLSPDPAHKFYPDQEFKRAEFAQLIQDILIKITKDDSLATKFIGEPSPFPDVGQDIWYYNAVRTVVSRGLMQAKNKVTGDFEPFAPVSGADALLTIRSMKEILKTYLR